MNYDTLSFEQLTAINDSLEEYLFKQPLLGEEPFSPTFRKDPEQFRKLIRLLVAFKRDLMAYFTKLYTNRWQLVNYHTIGTRPAYLRFDEYDDYFYPDEWEYYNLQLAQIIEKHKKKSYDLGILVLLALLGLGTNLTSDDKQTVLTTHALQISGDINTVTKKRIKKQIEASLKLNEDRAAFEQRLKKVLINPYRGRLIAENEGLQSFLDAQKDVAVENEYKYKKWTGVQTDSAEICGSVINEVVPIDENFSNGLPAPLAHLRCRCSLEYTNSKS